MKRVTENNIENTFSLRAQSCVANLEKRADSHAPMKMENNFGMFLSIRFFLLETTNLFPFYTK